MSGRNDPCPCGSGKKYKRCCLPTEEQARLPPGQDWHALDQTLGADIGKWAKRRFGEAWSTSPDDYPIDIEERNEHLPLFVSWATYERKIEGRPAASWYLEERGRHLMSNERDWLSAQLRSWLSVWEVLDVEPGTSIRLKDVLTGEERLVSEMVGSRTVTRHLLLLARVVDHAGLSLLVGMHPNPLPPEAGSEVVDDVRAEFGLGKRVDPQEMREGDRPTDLVGIWEEMIEHIESRPLPQLRNTDGEELVFTRDHYKLVGSTARATLEAELAKLPDVEAPDDDERERRYRVIRVGDAAHSGIGNTVVASIVVKAREVVVETNSCKRADGLRDRIQAAFADIIHFQKRNQQSVEEAMAKGERDKRNAPPLPEGPEVNALLRDVKAQHYATWSDHSLPALDGLTPREAASQPKYRSRLDRLLKEMEYHESQEEPGRRFDFSGIRRDLGLG